MHRHQRTRFFPSTPAPLTRPNRFLSPRSAAAMDGAEPAGGPLVVAVSGALRHLQSRPEDAAATELALRYAAAVDGAADVAEQLADVANQVDPADVDTRKWIAALAAKVDEQAVLAELGPKLLAVLVELGMTPKGRVAVVKGGGVGGGGKPSRLDQLRQEHAARVDAASAVDSSVS